MPKKIFLDSAYAIALSNLRDQHHQHAKQLSFILEREGTCFVTTSAILLEIGNALSKSKYREAAKTLLDSMMNDSNIEIVPLTDELFLRALQLYGERHDKEWGLTDCISFSVMRERNLTHALTTDIHFKQAEFHVL